MELVNFDVLVRWLENSNLKNIPQIRWVFHGDESHCRIHKTNTLETNTTGKLQPSLPIHEPGRCCLEFVVRYVARESSYFRRKLQIHYPP